MDRLWIVIAQEADILCEPCAIFDAKSKALEWAAQLQSNPYRRCDYEVAGPFTLNLPSERWSNE